MRTTLSARQAGFGLLETMTGLIVFVILAIVGTKAYRGVVANQKEASQVKALTDAVTVIAERLSAQSVSALTDPGSEYMAWSAPAEIGSGEYRFRYRTVPHPSVGGGMDTTVVGLEVEIGAAGTSEGFKAARLFATLIAPHLNSRDRLGETSTAKERAAETNFYNGLQARIKAVGSAGINDNQLRLNTYSCYDKGQCCGFMEKYFMDITVHPTDGVEEKCNYRCAKSGNVSVKEWTAACGKDFCAIAPWRTKEQCCAAIAKDECKPGSICASICIDCVGEDGSTCTTNATCNDGYWNDFFDCAKGTLCNGQPLPDFVPEWGNVKSMCKTAKCAAIPAGCNEMAFSCCNSLYGRESAGLPPFAGTQVCKDLMKKDDCCNTQVGHGYYNFTCSTDGKVITATYYNKNVTMCGAPPGSDWDRYCAVNKGCPSTYTTPGSTGGCGSWAGYPTDSPWTDPDPGSTGVHFFAVSGPTETTGTTGGPTTSKETKDRKDWKRDGNVENSNGGRE